MRKNKIIYAASVMHEEDFSILFKDAKMIPGQQAQKFNRLMIKGLSKNNASVRVISAPPVTRANSKGVFKLIKKRVENNVFYRYLPVVNLPAVKNVIILVLSFLYTFFTSLSGNTAIVCDVLNISVATGAVTAGRLLRRECIGIVTDIPELMVTGHTEAMVKLSHKIIEKCTKYVFLTEAMNERLNPKHKPYTIVEGICDEDVTKSDDQSAPTQKICMYAGLLDKEYGVKNMVDAFINAKIPDCVLNVCGNGPYLDELKSVTEKNKEVVYCGVLQNKDVVLMEKSSTLLINPRPSEGEFTKFSFPSKIMEYMTSGTPVLATRLPGIPDEYYQYIFAFSGDTTEEMEADLKRVLSISPEELKEIGHKAYEFVINNKNSVIQAKKVLDLINLTL